MATGRVYLSQLDLPELDAGRVVRLGAEGPFQGDLYLDGACYFPRDPQLARAGWAVVQMEGFNVARVAYGALPMSAGRQTCQTAETYALA
eukprot:6453048-Amphidinium_carterae.1